MKIADYLKQLEEIKPNATEELIKCFYERTAKMAVCICVNTMIDELENSVNRGDSKDVIICRCDLIVRYLEENEPILISNGNEKEHIELTKRFYKFIGDSYRNPYDPTLEERSREFSGKFASAAKLEVKHSISWDNADREIEYYEDLFEKILIKKK